MLRFLTTEAQEKRDDFIEHYGFTGNCSCFIVAPCGSCTHPGNPTNQEEDEESWLVVQNTLGIGQGGRP